MNEWAEFRHFRYLLEILKHRGFRPAAEHLHTAQPNLSAQARQFQEHFAIHLYRKGKDGRIKLTETGVAFRPIAQGLLDARDEAIAALIAIEHGEVRSLNFGCSLCVDHTVFHAACRIHKEIIPRCPIRPAYGEPGQLAEELISGKIDVAILTLPVMDLRLRLETIRRDRLVACLRRDHPCAAKAFLQPSDLQDNLGIFYDPQRRPLAHEELIERLLGIGIRIQEYARASHPMEMQELVRQGYGFALVREGIDCDPELVTRPIAGIDWTVDTAIIYNKYSHLKTIPVLVRHLKRYLTASTIEPEVYSVAASTEAVNGPPKRQPGSVGNG